VTPCAEFVPSQCTAEWLKTRIATTVSAPANAATTSRLDLAANPEKLRGLGGRI
jgi:hypothetical protein